jgi:Sec7-like guanine-nucleotide exchange factor
VRFCHHLRFVTLIPISDEVNIATMHAFVDMIDLRNIGFVDALRAFLQAFRLPGEAQKIDRYMLKFAERYIEGNTQTPFANAGEHAWSTLTDLC